MFKARSFCGHVGTNQCLQHKWLLLIHRQPNDPSEARFMLVAKQGASKPPCSLEESDPSIAVPCYQGFSFRTGLFSEGTAAPL